MLRLAAEGNAVIACTTCRFSAAARENGEGRRGGALLLEALHRVQAGDPSLADIAIEGMPCLFACDQACTVHLRAPGKIGYVLARFAPDDDAAAAILAFARAYAASKEGQIPLREWPQGVKGHFLVRVPPPGLIAE